MKLLAGLFDALWEVANRGARPDDNAKQRVRKAVITLTAMIIGFLAIFWGAIYVLLGYPLSGAIPLSYAVITAVSLPYYFLTKQFAAFRLSQLVLVLLLPFLLQWSLGGFSNGSIVMIWAFFTPLVVLLVDGPRSGLRWLLAFLALTVVSGVLDSHLAVNVTPMPRTAQTVFFILNMAVGLISVYGVLNYFVKDSERYQHTLRENQERITALMLTDPLTGVANRRRLDDCLREAARRVGNAGESLSVVIADLDHFKDVNDTYGHDVGDRMLQRFVEVARPCIRSRDLLARFGGEEFVIVLPDTPLEEARVVAERVRSCIERMAEPAIERPLTASFGVACSTTTPVSNLLIAADRALYRSKNEGRNRVSVAA